MRRIIIVLCIFFLAGAIRAQDVHYARKVLHKLTSHSIKGRGYVDQGDKKAASFIAAQLKKNGLLAFNGDYFQHYELPMNILDGHVKVSVDGKKLRPGYDFVVASSVTPVKGTFRLAFAPEWVTNDSTLAVYMDGRRFDSTFLVIRGTYKKTYGTSVVCNGTTSGYIYLTEKQPWWHVSDGYRQEGTCWLKSTAEYFPADAHTIELDIEATYEPHYQTQNVIAYVKGTSKPERFIVFTAHYDHLGMMGHKTYFPGANDNASGTSMLLDLAKHYSRPENQPDKSVVFMAFSGEEAGLKGSSYYVRHPLFPLEEIEFLINLDMVGTGSEGITVVNAKAYNDVLQALEQINKEHQYVPEIKARGEACNSDHCPFYQAGVKSIFIYTRGPEHTAYHSVFDTNKNFPFTGYEGLFRLVTDYVSSIQ